MSKVVVFGGDSFVEPSGITWPTHLIKDSRFSEGINVAQGGVGNKFIRMSTMWGVEKQIKKGINTSNLIVIVSWSAPSRYTLYTNQSDINLGKEYVGFEPNTDFTQSTSSDNFVYMPFCGPWDNPTNQIFYQSIENKENSIIDTLHDILYLQQYLKNKGIDYIMLTSWNIIDTPYDIWDHEYKRCGDSTCLKSERLDKPEYKWIIDLIDLEKFIPLKGQWEWTNKNFIGREKDPNSHHPLDHEHLSFTEQIIIPFYENLYGK